LATAALQAGRQWWWQTCAELAYFNTAPANNSIRSSFVSLTYFRNACSTIFTSESALAVQLFLLSVSAPRVSRSRFALPFASDWYFPPDTNAVNVMYGGAQIDATNVIFTNGVEDP